MAFAVTNWNIQENNAWYVRLADAGSNIRVSLHLTSANAVANSAAQATGSASFGTDTACTLTTGTLNKYESEVPWHLRVTGTDGDATKIIKVGPFTDIEEVRDPIFFNADIISIRAKAEIDQHTYMRLVRNIDLATHNPTLEVGQIVSMNSTRRNKNEMSQIDSLTFTLDMGNDGTVSMTDSLSTSKYVAMTRE